MFWDPMDFVSHFHGLRYFKLKLCYLSHFKSTTSCAGARMNMWSFNFSASKSLISMFLLQPNVVGYLKRLSKFIKLLGIGGFKVMFAWDVFCFLHLFGTKNNIFFPVSSLTVFEVWKPWCYSQGILISMWLEYCSIGKLDHLECDGIVQHFS